MRKKGIKPGKKLTVEIYHYTKTSDDFKLGLWRSKASCAELISMPGTRFTTTDWFPPVTTASPSEEVVKVCGECPVRLECLTYAIQTMQPEGIWAGHGHKKVRAMGRRIKSASWT